MAVSKRPVKPSTRAGAPNKYAKLPEPIRPEDMIESVDVENHPTEKDDYWREVEWMLRTSGGI